MMPFEDAALVIPLAIIGGAVAGYAIGAWQRARKRRRYDAWGNELEERMWRAGEAHIEVANAERMLAEWLDEVPASADYRHAVERIAAIGRDVELAMRLKASRLGILPKEWPAPGAAAPPARFQVPDVPTGGRLAEAVSGAYTSAPEEEHAPTDDRSSVVEHPKPAPAVWQGGRLVPRAVPLRRRT